MPFWIGDYIRDTMHLSAAESGAYLHLIMAYWVSGGLPNDDRKLAVIAKMELTEWKETRPTIEAFFGPGFSSHKRIDKELVATAEKIANRSEVGRKGGIASGKVRKEANVKPRFNLGSTEREAKTNQSHSEEEREERKKDAAPDGAPLPDPAIAERELFKRGKEVLGNGSGGLIANILKAKGGNVALARAAVEQASTKQSPREYAAQIARGPPQAAKAPPRPGSREDTRERTVNAIRTALWDEPDDDPFGSPIDGPPTARLIPFGKSA